MNQMLTQRDISPLCKGSSFLYTDFHPVVRLYDREQLPWPSCSLQWKGKQPSWRRIGSRYIPDMGNRKSPSYSARLVKHEITKTFIVAPNGDCLLDTFVNQVTGSFPEMIPSGILQQLTYDRNPISIKEEYFENQEVMNALLPEPLVVTQYPIKFDANEQRWATRNNHYHPEKQYEVA